MAPAMAAQSRAMPAGFWVDPCSCFYGTRVRCTGEMVLERVWLISRGVLAEFTSESKSKMGTKFHAWSHKKGTTLTSVQRA